MGWGEGQLGTPLLLVILILIVLSTSTTPEPVMPHTQYPTVLSTNCTAQCPTYSNPVPPIQLPSEP